MNIAVAWIILAVVGVGNTIYEKPNAECNPIAVTEVTEGTPKDEIRRCLEIKLKSKRDGSVQTVWANITNNCRSDVAVLADPIEIRKRLTNEERFNDELMLGDVYGILYVYSPQFGFEESFFQADAGVDVIGLPGYFVVRVGSTSRVPICGLERLDVVPGDYRLRVRTVAAPATGPRTTDERFRLEDSVTAHNGRNPQGSRVYLRPTAEYVVSDEIVVHLQGAR